MSDVRNLLGRIAAEFDLASAMNAQLADRVERLSAENTRLHEYLSQDTFDSHRIVKPSYRRWRGAKPDFVAVAERQPPLPLPLVQIAEDEEEHGDGRAAAHTVAESFLATRPQSCPGASGATGLPAKREDDDDAAADPTLPAPSARLPPAEDSAPLDGTSRDMACVEESKGSAHIVNGMPTSIGGFPVWPCWTGVQGAPAVELGNTGIDLIRLSHGSLNAMTNSGKAIRSGDVITSKRSPLRHLMTRPFSTKRIAWDVMSLFIMGYDIVFIPLMAFNLQRSALTIAATWCTTIFWTCDILNSCSSGYHKRGVLEMRPRKVFKKYIKSWCLPDCIVVLVDWVVLLNEMDMHLARALRIGKSLRYTRALRMLRLLRILKVMSTVAEFSDIIQSGSLVAMLNIGKSVVGVTVVNHSIACAWFAMGNLPSSGRPSWVETLKTLHGQDLSFGFSYTTSLHWSLTQFTPASMEVVPTNTSERIFVICVIIFALVMFSSFISSITSTMTHLRVTNLEHTKQNEYIRRYLSDNRVSLELSHRIYTFLRLYRKTQKKRVHDSDIPVFKHLPELLMVELHVEVFMPHLVRHPLFDRLSVVDDRCLASICHLSTAQCSAVVDKEIFTFGEEARKMFFVINGMLDYVIGALKKAKAPVQVHSGSHACEMALWAQWEHRGRLVATQYSDLVALNSEGFRKIVCRSMAFSQCREYTRLYAAKVREEFGVNWTRIPDIWPSIKDAWEMSCLAFDVVGGQSTHSFSGGADASSDAQTYASGLYTQSFRLGERMRQFARRMSRRSLGTC